MKITNFIHSKKKAFESPHAPFWWLTAGIMALLTLPKLMQDGMFMDAMLYTSVAHNLSQGFGSFWFPQFGAHNIADLPSFHEQPPLVFGIESLFFMVFGSSMYVERFYTFLTMLATAGLMLLLWRSIYQNDHSIKKVGWLALILWITIPVCFWTYTNNMNENTMGVFTLLSVLFIYHSFQSKKHQIWLWIFAGVGVFLATMSKGIPGFFPIVTPLLYWTLQHKITFKKATVITLVISLVPLLIYLILLYFPDSKESLTNYFIKRALQRIKEVPTVNNRFYIIERLFMELLPQLLFLLLFFALSRWKKWRPAAIYNKGEAFFFIAVGLSASAPLLLTLVQKGFYFVPALPFFGIGFGMLIAPYVTSWISKLAYSKKPLFILSLFSVVFFLTTLTITAFQVGKASRDKVLLHDIYQIGAIVPKYTIVGVTPEIWDNWSLQCYFVRYFNISVEPNRESEYKIIYKKDAKYVMSGYKAIPLNTIDYVLFQRK